MRIASVKPNDLAVVKDGSLILIGDALAVQGLLSKGASMIDFIAHYESLKNSLEGAIAGEKLKAEIEKIGPMNLLVRDV
jgi:hypothetical protein